MANDNWTWTPFGWKCWYTVSNIMVHLYLQQLLCKCPNYRLTCLIFVKLIFKKNTLRLYSHWSKVASQHHLFLLYLSVNIIAVIISSQLMEKRKKHSVGRQTREGDTSHEWNESRTTCKVEKCRREKNKKADGRSDVEENPRRLIDGLPDRFDEKITD